MGDNNARAVLGSIGQSRLPRLGTAALRLNRYSK
jgi:hypothetical protein